MKKIFLSVLFLFIISSFHSVLADNYSSDDLNWGVHPLTEDEQNAGATSPSEKVWNKERDEIIDENFGSDQSPSFLNVESPPVTYDNYPDYDPEDNDYYDYGSTN